MVHLRTKTSESDEAQNEPGAEREFSGGHDDKRDERTEETYETGGNSANWERERRYGKILDLRGSVTRDDIKDRYRKLVARYHPDKVQHLGEEFQRLAEERMKEINEAYDYFRKRYSL